MVSIDDSFALRSVRTELNARGGFASGINKDAFFGEMYVTQGSDSKNSYFDGYINASTNAQVLIKQYEKVVASRYEKEGGSSVDQRSYFCLTTMTCRVLTPLKGGALFILSRTILSLRMLGLRITIVDSIIKLLKREK